MSCKYHEYEIVGEDDKEVGEKCKRCSAFVSYRKVEGRIDNKKYLKDHIRDFIQPEWKSVYIEIHGEKAYAHSMKVRADKEAELTAPGKAMEEGMDNVRESLKHWKYLESKGYTRGEIIQAIENI